MPFTGLCDVVGAAAHLSCQPLRSLTPTPGTLLARALDPSCARLGSRPPETPSPARQLEQLPQVRLGSGALGSRANKTLRTSTWCPLEFETCTARPLRRQDNTVVGHSLQSPGHGRRPVATGSRLCCPGWTAPPSQKLAAHVDSCIGADNGRMLDRACGSRGMFVQSAHFTSAFIGPVALRKSLSTWEERTT